MFRTWTVPALVAELQEIAREMLTADSGDLPRLLELQNLVQDALRGRV